MSFIRLIKGSITNLETDAIVNAANDRLLYGGGVCGCIFRAAGVDSLQRELSVYDRCPPGSAVITSGCALKAKHIIHAVGPVYKDGRSGEEKILARAYISSLLLARSNNLHSIAFPLISSGIYGYPQKEAFEVALEACRDFISANKDYEIEIVFALIDDELFDLCSKLLGKDGR